MIHQGAKNGQMESCIELCKKCESSCLETLAYCLEKGGKHAEKNHISLLQVCADICATSTRAMILGTEHHSEICASCATLCEACAESCESFTNDEQMKNCAEVCRECAEACSEMAGTKTKQGIEQRPSSTQSAPH